jgi:hypothetical protein
MWLLLEASVSVDRINELGTTLGDERDKLGTCPQSNFPGFLYTNQVLKRKSTYQIRMEKINSMKCGII